MDPCHGINHIEQVICAACSSEIAGKAIYSVEMCPVLNNVLYDSQDDARTALAGPVVLMQCPFCGHVFNACFDQKLLHYDTRYNSARNGSQVYRSHVAALQDSCSRWLTSKDIVLELGCGDGTFLRGLSDNTGCYGFGYDPAYMGNPTYGGRIRFKKAYFDPANAEAQYNALILRHVLEHVPHPFELLRTLSTAKVFRPGARLFIEVPDISWIIKNRAYFDITYEHCNYFSVESLTEMVRRAGWEIVEVRSLYGSQYLAILAEYVGIPKNPTHKRAPANLGTLFQRLRAAKELLEKAIGEAESACVWGASGKGVIFMSQLPEELRERITLVIDIDPLKQGKYIPVSAKKVHSPEALKGLKTSPLVLVMNEVYEKEIASEIKQQGFEASLLCAAFSNPREHTSEDICS